MSKTNNSSRGLGRGFDVLIPTDFDDSIIAEDKNRVKNISILNLVRNEDQPRKHFDDQELEQLAQSIKRHGILQPLVVTAAATKGKYMIIAGERRWRAAQKAGLDEVPVIVRTLQELEKLEIGLIENVQRVDLSPLEQAASIARLHNDFNISYDEIAGRIGKAVTTINNTVRLLQLPPNAQAALREEKITEGHARSILALKPDTKRQLELLQLIIDHGWSVRQAESYVVACKQGATTARSAERRTVVETPLTKRLTKVLNAPVTVKHTAKGGQLMIGFKSEEDLKRITDLLSSN